MCASCGIPGHRAGTPLPAPRRFAALRNPECRTYLTGAALAMMADNIEHVITYWVLWQRFHSPVLAGFQVISHWVPYLLLSVPFGALADRFDCRRVVQAAQALFLAVSLAWGVLFATGTLSIGAACALLVLHGTAGALWGPGEQLLLHGFVGDRDLPSAVRLNATSRSLGILFGPVVGSALLIALGPTAGIVVNAAIYLPLILFLFRTRVTGHLPVTGVTDGADGADGVPRRRIGLRDTVRVLASLRHDRTILSMIVLAGLGAFFVGASLQSVMPVFADRMHGGSAGYGLLLFATGAGGVIGGVLLEATDRIRPTVRTAVLSTAVYGASIAAFAGTANLPLALMLLFVGGAANLASMSIGQTVVQLLAPPGERGRVIGAYNLSANGLRLGSGFTVGVAGAAVGVPTALGISALCLCAGTAIAAAALGAPARAEP